MGRPKGSKNVKRNVASTKQEAPKAGARPARTGNSKAGQSVRAGSKGVRRTRKTTVTTTRKSVSRVEVVSAPRKPRTKKAVQQAPAVKASDWKSVPVVPGAYYSRVTVTDANDFHSGSTTSKKKPAKYEYPHNKMSSMEWFAVLATGAAIAALIYVWVQVVVVK